MKIPLMDIQAQYFSVKQEIDEAVHKVMNEAGFIGGPEKDNFEKEYSEMFGSRYTIGVANGTDAIFLVLKAMGIGPGDEVVTAANSFIASSEAVTAVGARVVFCDVDEKTFLMDFNRLEEILKKCSHRNGGKIKAILPVHLYGRIYDMNKLMGLAEKYGVQVIEDTAQAHLAKWQGRTAGTFGAAGTFSFYPGKNLGAFGDAGAVVTNNPDLAETVRKLANHGRGPKAKYEHDIEGYNSRLDSLQAAVLRVKLKHLKKWTEARQEKALTYDKMLSSMDSVIRPEIPSRDEHVFHLYVVRVQNREEVHQKLQKKNISAGIHHPVALPFLKAYQHMGFGPKDFPVAHKLSQEILSLPLYPEISLEAQSEVVRSLKEAIK